MLIGCQVTPLTKYLKEEKQDLYVWVLNNITKVYIIPTLLFFLGKLEMYTAM